MMLHVQAAESRDPSANPALLVRPYANLTAYLTLKILNAQSLHLIGVVTGRENPSLQRSTRNEARASTIDAGGTSKPPWLENGPTASLARYLTVDQGFDRSNAMIGWYCHGRQR